MKTKKLFSVIIAVIMIISVFSACSNNAVNENPSAAETIVDTENNEPTAEVSDGKINVSLLKGPTGMGGAYLWTKSDNGETLNDYNFTLDTDASTVAPKLMTGEYDIAAIPTNLAASVFKKSEGKIKVIAVNTLGVLYILSKNNTVSSVKDLKDKTILASGEGTVAQYALDYVLESNGLNVGEDVNVEYSTEHSESVTKALLGDYDIVLLPEPFVSQLLMKDDSFSVAVNLTEEWEKAGGCVLTMGCLAVNSAFYETHKHEVALFLADYRESVDYIDLYTDEVAGLIESHDIMPAAVAKKAIPNANIVCLTGEEMKTALESFYGVLMQQNPQIIGGSLPDESFYVVE